MNKITKREFYKKIFKEGYLNREVLTMILEDIGDANEYRNDLGRDDTTIINKEGIVSKHYEYVDDIESASGYRHTCITKAVSWEDMVGDFFDDLEEGE